MELCMIRTRRAKTGTAIVVGGIEMIGGVRVRKCGTCFRYCEDWRDAKAKGLSERYGRFGEYSHKPRNSVKPKCTCGEVKEGLHKNHAACKYHEYRWTWNLRMWWRWSFRQRISWLYRDMIRKPIGRLRKPVPLQFTDYFDGWGERIIPDYEPVCPHCGEMPYSHEQCVFCGQRFVVENENKKDK